MDFQQGVDVEKNLNIGNAEEISIQVSIPEVLMMNDNLGVLGFIFTALYIIKIILVGWLASREWMSRPTSYNMKLDAWLEIRVKYADRNWNSIEIRSTVSYRERIPFKSGSLTEGIGAPQCAKDQDSNCGNMKIQRCSSFKYHASFSS